MGTNETAKRTINIMIVISMILGSLSAMIFLADRVSAGPIVVIEVTGQKSGTATENGDPGDDILFNVRVENNGDSIATINLTILGAPGGWSSTLTGINFTVSAGNHQTEILRVSIPANAVETASASLTVKCTTNNKQDTCEVLVDQVYGLIFESADTIESSLPDKTITFTLPVNNTGNGIDTTSFTESGAPGAWAVSFDSTKNLPAFTVANLEVAVYIPESASTGTYSITVRGTSEDTVTYSTKTLTVTVLAEYGLTVSTLPSGNLETKPGGKVTYTLNVENVGNARDRFNLAIDTGNKTAGWTATLGTARTPQVSAGAKYNVSLYVTAPIGAKDTDLGYVNVTATSHNNGSQSEMAYTITNVLQERYLSLSVDNSSVEGPQKGTVRFTFTLTNSGNGQDRVDITGTPPQGWSSPNISPTYFALGASATGQFTVDQAIPSDALHQGYTLIVTAKSRDDNTNSTSSVTVDVTQKYGIQVTVPGSNSKDFNPGETKVYNFTVKNKGNGEDTFSISQSGIPQGWSWALSDSSVTLGAAKEQNVGLAVTVPNNYENFGPLEVELIAVSDGNATARDNSTKIIINVQKSYSVVLTCNNPNKNGFPEDTIYYEITITNDGNAEDLIEISIDAGDYSDWSSINDTLYTIAPNTYSTVNLTVTIPADQPAGYYHVNITATSKRAEDQGDDKKDTMATRTRVKPLFSVYLFPDGGNVSDVAAGMSHTYLLGVQNRGLDTDTFDISITGDNPFTNWVNMEFNNYTIENLGRDKIERISFDTTIPANVYENYPNINSGTITITAASRGNPASTFALNFETTVKAKFGGSLTSESDYDSALPGENVTFIVYLKNTGSLANDTFGLKSPDCPFDQITITPSQVVVNRSEFQEFQIVVLIDDDAKEGNHLFNVSARTAGSDRVLSRDDEIIATLQLKIGVIQRYGARASCALQTQNVAPNDWVTYEIEIENEGNGLDTFDITKDSTVVGHIGWAKINISRVYLKSDDTIKVELNVSIPNSVEPINVIIYVNATSRGDNSVVASIRTVTTVTQDFAIRLTTSINTKTTDPGAMVKFYIDVKNRGTGSDEIEVSIVKELPAGANSDWANIPSEMLVFTLAPNAIKRITVNVTPPEDQEVGNFPITIKAESQDDPEKIFEEITVTTRVNPKRDLALEVAENRKEVIPNLSGSKATVTYSLKVTNKGTDSDTFKLEIRGSGDTPNSDHPSWVKLSTYSIGSLAEDSDNTVTVTVTIPNNQAPTNSDGFNTTIYVYSGKKGTADEIGATITMVTVIDTAYGLELSASKKRMETADLTSLSAKNREVQFSFKVKNIGTGDDTIKFDINQKPTGWEGISFDVGTEDILKGVTSSHVLTVRIDRDVAVDDYDIEIKIISRGDDTLYEDTDVYETMKFTVEVTQIHQIKISAAQSSKEAKPGDTVTYTLTVKNRGNQMDSITLDLPNEIIYWSTRTISPRTVDIEPDGSIDITVTFRVSSDYTEALEDTYYTNITATAGEGTDEYKAYVELTTLIAQEYLFEVTSSDWASEGKVDVNGVKKTTDIEFFFEIKNKGNGKDSFKFDLTGDYYKWGTITPQTSAELDAGETQKITVTVTIGDDFDKYMAKDYEIGLTVKSVGDEEVEDTDKSFTLTIEEVYSLVMTKYPSITINLAEKSSATLDVEVENAGNKDDTIRFTVRPGSPDDWVINILPSTKMIKMGNVQTVSIEVTPDDNVEENYDDDDYSIIIRATSDDGTYKDFSFNVIIEMPVLKITGVTFKESVNAGEETTITVTVENSGKADAEDVLITLYDKTKKITIGSFEISIDGVGSDGKVVSETYDFTDWDKNKVTKGTHKVEASLTNEPSGDTDDLEKPVEVIEEGGGWIYEKGAQYTIGGLVVFFIVVIIIVLLFSRSQRPIPEDLKEEIAKAKAEAERERPREKADDEKDVKKVKKDDIEKLLTKKTLPSKAQAALPQSTKKGKDDKKPVKQVKIKCPKCEIIQTVTSQKRPLEFECDDCGMKLILKK
ncbi:MAG: hypothetical protein QF682_07620 [Candidatus Thermoplasmatota archaeon]|jgi:uncharacterized membrane protein/predicted RNA-binding Zn-ribbon protein involved in translation (DUF1610 family)|nr:hypothetical protein [Candidatus Thermoplasmatota archaeon]